MNEGLEKLGEYKNGREGDVFAYSAIENIRLPSTLKRIEIGTFKLCKNLKNVIIPSGVEFIGDWCFYGSGIEEITLPSTLEGTCGGVFYSCSGLKTVWMEEGCTLDVRKYVDKSVEVRYK